MEVADWSSEEDEFEGLEIAGVQDLGKIQDLTLDNAYDLGVELGVLGGRVTGLKEIQLALRIHFLAKVGGMESKGREPFKILANIQDQHRKKCFGLAGLFNDLKIKLLDSTWTDLVGDLTNTVKPSFEFPRSFEDHVTRLTREESCKIMITGELCSGKTTLINSLLGETVLPSSELSNTITLCEIRWGPKRTAKAIPWQPSERNICLATVLIMEPPEYDEAKFPKDDGNKEEVDDFERGYTIIYTVAIEKEEDCKTVARMKLELDRSGNPKYDHTPRKEHNKKLGRLGEDANTAIELWHNRSTRLQGASTQPVAIRVLAKGELFVQTLAQFVQAKQRNMDDLGVYKVVEVYIPNKLLEGGLTLVDSPGIGDNQSLNDMVIEYTAEAFAFIYVINAAMKGGVQEDRLQMLLNRVHRKRMLNDRPMFSTESAIFVCNKWDEVAQANQDRVMKHIVKNLEDCWPGVSEHQIVPFCASDALKVYEHNLLTPEFKDLLQKFERLIPYGLENKLNHSICWLEGILMKIDQFLLGCLGNLNMSSIQLRTRFLDARGRMDRLEKLSEDNFKELHKFVESQVDEAVNLLTDYLAQEDVMERIATWSDDEIPSTTMKDWLSQRRLICTVLEGKVKPFVNTWAKDTKFMVKVNTAVKDRFMKWIGTTEVSDELEKIRDIVVNREELELMLVPLSGFIPRKDSALMEKVQVSVVGAWQKHKIKMIVASPVLAPVAILAAFPLVVALGFDTFVNMAKQQFTMAHLEAYRDNRAAVLYEETKDIVKEYCKTKQFRQYVARLLEDSFALVQELRKVIPDQLDQERSNISKIERDHQSGVHKQRRYEPMRQVCLMFRRYIEEFALMNISMNERGVKVIPYHDVTMERSSSPVARGWCSEVLEVNLSTSAGTFWLRRQLAPMQVTDVSCYLLEEAVWKYNDSLYLPRLVSVTIHEERVHHILADCGEISLRKYLQKSLQKTVLDTLTKQGTEDLKTKIARLKPLAIQITEALRYLHNRGVMCGDLTLDTVTIVERTDTIKLTNVTYPKRLKYFIEPHVIKRPFPENADRLRYLPKEVLAEVAHAEEDDPIGDQSCEEPNPIAKTVLRKTSSEKKTFKLKIPSSKSQKELPSQKEKETVTVVYHEKCDVYSFALLLWEMTSSEIAFDKQMKAEDVTSLAQFFEKILQTNMRPEIPDLNSCSDVIVNWFALIESCWRTQSSTRPSAQTIEKVLKTTAAMNINEKDEDEIEIVAGHFG